MKYGYFKMEDEILSQKKSIWKKLLPYFMTGMLTGITLIIMLYALKIYPFGDKAYLWADADQYFGIESYFGSLLGKNDIFYSWGNVLGGNALAELAYYSFSPFNVIFILFHDHMIFAAHFVAYIKIIASALAFCYCLLSTCDEKNILIKATLSTCYAFMGYMVFYGWNTSWMDGVILLPLMYVGIRKIIQNKNIFLYVFSLAVAVISNFYIGFMLCIGSFILYVVQLLLSDGKFADNIKKSFIKYMFASLVGVGISAFLLIPTYLGLPSDRSLTIFDLFKDMSFNTTPAEILSGLFTGQSNTLKENAPLIYVGMFVLILDILFFINKKISFRKKTVYSAVILIFFISFENSFINQIWHGLSKNHCFNYRYSFLLSFVLLLIAWETCQVLKEELPPKEDLLKAVLILGVILAFVIQNASDKINILGISLDILLILIFITAFSLKNLRVRKATAAILSCGVVVSLACNGYFYLKDIRMQSCNTYGTNKAMMENATETINDDSFYRMDKSFSLGRCDTNLFDYNGVSNYASTENVENLKFLKKLGVRHKWMWAKYTTNTPLATEALLGFRYILTNRENAKGYEAIGEGDGIKYYRNQYALPVLFPVNDFENFDLDELNDFQLLNQIWASINGLQEDIFTPNTVSNTSHDGENQLTVTVENTGSLYLLIPSRSSYNSFKVTGAGREREIRYDDASEVYYIGEFDRGESLDISFAAKDGNFDLDSISCYTENKDIIYQNSQLVNQQNLSIEEKSSSHLIMSYSGKSSNIATTIPYDEGWTVYDNGKKLTIEKNWNNFLAFQLDDADEHNIELVYRPTGFGIGSKITIFSIVLLILFEILNLNTIKNRLRKKRA